MPADLIDQLASDPDFLKLSEADQDQMYEELSGRLAQAQPSPARKIINALFTPSRFAEGAGQLIGRQLQTGQEVLGATALGQLAKVTADPFTRIMAARAPQQIGQTIGAAIDPANLVLGGAASIPNRVARMVATGATGAMIPALRSYGERGDAFANPLNVALGGTLGTLGGAFAKVNPRAVLTGEGSPVQAQPLPEIPITTATKARALQSIRQGFLQAPKIAGSEFEHGLTRLADQNPNQRVDLSGVVKQLKDAETTTPGIKAVLNRAIRTNRHAAFVESLLSKEPETASTLTIQEAQAFKRTLQDALRNKFNQFAPELNDVHLELLDAYHGTRVAQLEAFPEMQDVLAHYRQNLSKFRALKPFFRQGRLSRAILGELSKEPELRTMAEQLLPEETLKQIGRYRTTQQVISGARFLTGAVTIEEVIRRLLGR